MLPLGPRRKSPDPSEEARLESVRAQIVRPSARGCPVCMFTPIPVNEARACGKRRDIPEKKVFLKQEEEEGKPL